MELQFLNINIRDICIDESKAEQMFGEIVAKSLVRTIADLRAAASMEDILLGTPRFAMTSTALGVILQLKEGYVLSCAANNGKIKQKESTSFQWSSVTRLKILEITEEHE